MNSEQADTLYARWLAGEISPTEEQQLRASGEWTELEKIRAATDLLALPDYDTEAGYARFRKEKMQPQAKVRRLLVVRILAIAAGIAALIVAGIFLLQNPDTKVFAQNGTNLTYQLPDQSKVILNDGSGIVFNEKNWSITRRVQLTGEALFSVAKGRTFLVETANGTVEVLGTEFNVRAWNDGLLVECYEGRVAITANQQEQQITANQYVQLTKNGLSEPQSLSAERPSWLSGQSRFYNASVVEIFAELERQFAIKINLPANLDQQFTGVFTHTNLEQALRNVCLPLELNYTINEDVVQIERR